MSNERLIKAGHIFILAGIALMGLIIFASTAEVIPAALSLQTSNK